MTIGVSDLSLYHSLAGDLMTQQAAIGNLDSQLSSGLAVQQPSDNPVGAVEALGYQSQLSQLNASSSAATTASAWLGIANSGANSVIGVIQSARTLMLQALNSGAQTSQSYQQTGQQVQGMIQQLVGLANSTYAGTAIFAGTASVAAPYSSTGAYSGNEQSFTIQVGPGTPTIASVPGTSLFGGGTTGVQSLFTTLQSFATHLSAGPGGATEASIQTDLNNLDANLAQATTAATTLGEASQQVQAAATAATSTSAQVQKALATTVDVNVATVSTQLQADMASYQAALYAVSQAVPESLAQFIH